MKPLWTTWRCRHNANLFFLVFAAFILIPVLIGQTDWGHHLIPVLVVLGSYLLLLATVALYRTWSCQREKIPRPPLSRDELRKARSKLVKKETT